MCVWQQYLASGMMSTLISKIISGKQKLQFLGMDGDAGWVAMQDGDAWRKFNLFDVSFQNIRDCVKVKSNISVSVTSGGQGPNPTKPAPAGAFYTPTWARNIDISRSHR